jgi:histidinol-phosphate aminotransferase
MRAYTPGEQPRDRRYVKLNTNENPYPPSPLVLRALREAVGEDLRVYPDPLAERLREKAAAVYGVEKENVLVGNGSDEVLAIVMRACVERGDPVAYPVPTYSLYDTLVAIQGGEARRVPFPEDFSLPPALFETEARVTLLCNPNSPSGTFVPVARIEELAGRVRGLLVVDEAYVDFAPQSALALVRRHPRVMVVRTFSKAFSLAGLRVGLGFAHPDLIAELAKVKDSYNVSRLSLAAALAALEDYGWMRRNAERIKDGRRRLVAGLERLGFFVHPSEANFVLARRPGRSLEPLYLALRERGVLVRYFSGLGDALRITVGAKEEIEALLRALEDALVSLGWAQPPGGGGG